SNLRRSFEAEKLTHVTIVFFSAAFRAQVKTQFVDDFDAVVPLPLLETIGAHGLEDSLAGGVAKRRRRQLAGAGAEHAAGPLAAEAALARRGLAGAGFLGRGDGLAQLAKHF